MIEYVHKHITAELNQNTRTDTIFIVTSIFLNLITLAVNSGISKESRTNTSSLIVMFVFVSLIVIVNLVVVIGLIKGKGTRSKLLNGLMEMYRDQKVEKYYDASLLENYNLRYNLFILVVVFTGVIAAIVPFILR
jgi:hypothetical protein